MNERTKDAIACTIVFVVILPFLPVLLPLAALGWAFQRVYEKTR
jgi:hypothetical protein